MAERHLAEVIMDGPSQIVRLPAEFHLDAEVVEIRRVPDSRELILAPAVKSSAWERFFARVNEAEVCEEFMADRPMNHLPLDRKIFEHE
jgi:antitoxin VapB